MYREWLGALRGIQWVSEMMNASLAGTASRLPVATPPALWTVVGIALALFTIWRMRESSIAGAWMPLAAASLLASPLGWVYYGAWLLPGSAIGDWIDGIALGWCAPLLVVALFGTSSAIGWMTIGSCYGWTLIAIWYRAIARAGHWRVSTDQPSSSYSRVQPPAASRLATRESDGTNAQRMA